LQIRHSAKPERLPAPESCSVLEHSLRRLTFPVSSAPFRRPFQIAMPARSSPGLAFCYAPALRYRLVLRQRFMSPRQYLPAMQTRNAPQAPRGIDGNGMADRRKHPAIKRRIAVRAALRQRNSPLAREPFYCQRFFLAEHCSAGDPAGPPPIANFQLCRQHGNFHFEAAPKEFAFKSEFRNFRKRSERSTHQDDRVSTQRVPPDALDRCWKKRRERPAWKGGAARKNFDGYAAQIHFVALRRPANIAQPKPNCFYNPSKIIGGRNSSAPAKVPEKSPFERGLGKQRSINIEKSDAHAGSAEDLRACAATASLAKKCQPSSRTGNPRSRQNA